MKVLVTGVGGDIGFGIGRILKERYPNVFLLGIDVNSDNPARCIYDSFHEAPLATHADYKSFLLQLIREFSIDIIIPTSEAEIAVFWEKDIVAEFRALNKVVIILEREIVDVTLDKYKTYLFLKDNGFSFPSTVLANDYFNQDRKPKILKPRSGQGSKNIRIIHSPSELEKHELNENFIVQELLSDEESEYTCCIYRDNIETRQIILKRKMQGGFTSSGEVVQSDDIKGYIVDIANKLELIGSINLQLRMTGRGPVLFEINPRFSSTVVFRDKMGFSDLVWVIEYQLNNRTLAYTPPKKGLKFYRGIKEYFVH